MGNGAAKQHEQLVKEMEEIEKMRRREKEEEMRRREQDLKYQEIWREKEEMSRRETNLKQKERLLEEEKEKHRQETESRLQERRLEREKPRQQTESRLQVRRLQEEKEKHRQKTESRFQEVGFSSSDEEFGQDDYLTNRNRRMAACNPNQKGGGRSFFDNFQRSSVTAEAELPIRYPDTLQDAQKYDGSIRRHFGLRQNQTCSGGGRSFFDNFQRSSVTAEAELPIRYPDTLKDAQKDDGSIRRHFGLRQNQTCSGRLPFKIDLSQTLQLNIVCEAIETQHVDVIVCPTYQYPKLSGATAIAIQTAGGQQFEYGCKQLGTIEFGQMKRTGGGGQLSCSHVYLTKLRTCWSKGSWQVMYNIVEKSLEGASKYNQRSIAFPLFGTGQCKYPADKVVEAMIKSVRNFANRRQHTTLTHVFIVVYIKNEDTTRIIEQCVPQMVTEICSDSYTSNLQSEIRRGSTSLNLDRTSDLNDRKVNDRSTVPFFVEDVAEVELDPYDRTYIDVMAKFTQGKCSYSSIERIVRIQNKCLLDQYQARKRFLEKQNPHTIQTERELWHATDKETAQQIVNRGYNRSYAGKHATKYGCGTYFAVESAYSGSDLYAKPDSNGVRRMILNKVLTGYYTKVDRNAKYLPTRITTDNVNIPYDSAVDDLNNIEMFIIFHDCQAYPEYLIEYRS